MFKDIWESGVRLAKEGVADILFGSSVAFIFAGLLFTMFAWHYGVLLALCITSSSFLFYLVSNTARAVYRLRA